MVATRRRFDCITKNDYSFYCTSGSVHPTPKENGGSNRKRETKSFCENLRFRDGLVSIVGQTVEIKLCFQISTEPCGRCLRVYLFASLMFTGLPNHFLLFPSVIRDFQKIFENVHIYHRRRVTVENLQQFSESVGTNGHRLSHKTLHVDVFTSSQGLAAHLGHSLSSHRSVVGGFVIASQLISLSLHSTERLLIPEPQVTEHCKRTVDHISLVFGTIQLKRQGKEFKIADILCPSLLSSNTDTV